MDIKYKHLKFAVVIYAAIPIAIFFIGWLNIISAIVFTFLIISLCFFVVKSSKKDNFEQKSFFITKKQFILLAVISVVWCILAGQGGIMHQSSDHIIRNAIFRDMIIEPWPVTYTEDRYMLCYYIAYWTLPSVVGKAVFVLTGVEFAGFLAGNIIMLIWSCIGTMLVLLLVTLTTGSEKPRPILSSVLFIFFSGLDAVYMYLSGKLIAEHLEWWAEYFQFSSNTTCLFWVYNQTIVIWLVVLCIINETKMRDFAALGMLALPYGPFPFVGIVILCVIKGIFIAIQYIKGKEIKVLFSDIFSLNNMLGILSIAPVYVLYYTANVVVANAAESSTGTKIETGFRLHSVLANCIDNGYLSGFFSFLGTYLLFILLEVGVYTMLVIIGNKGKQDKVFLISTLTLLFIPLFQVGAAYDLAMRVSIPSLLYLCISVIRLIKREIPEKGEIKDINELVKKKVLLVITTLVFFFGTLTPFAEFRREIFNTIYYGNVYSNKISSYEGFSYKHNFTADWYKESAFYKWFCK